MYRKPLLSRFVQSARSLDPYIPMTGKRGSVAGGGPASPDGSPPASLCSNRLDQDGFLPIANVSRIMKRSLATNAKISKEAKETVQECVSEFISFITGEASDKCQREKRKTINGDDLLWAMTTLGFENYVGPLKIYLNRYRETEGEKINSMARQQEDNNCGGGGFGGFIKEMPKIGGPLGGSLGISRGTDFQSLYGQSLISGAGGLGLNRIHDNGDANGGRAVAAQIHNGVGW